MPPQPSLSTELTREEKLRIACAPPRRADTEALDLLIGLASDPIPAVRDSAGQTLTTLSNERLAEMIANPLLSASAASYLLDPGRVRAVLLPALLAHPSTPEESVCELAAKGSSEVLAVLIEHLELLKTRALEALKRNPAARNRAKKPSGIPATLDLPPAEKLSLARNWTALPSGNLLPTLVTLAFDPDLDASGAAQKSLSEISDERCVELAADASLPEFVARYFLDPAHVRPGLLPTLLAHPNVPQDAITVLAGHAPPAALAVLLDQLDLLKTPALRALKDNTAYLDWQSSPPEEGFVLEVDLLEMLIEEVESGKLSLADLPPIEEIEGVDPAKSEGTFARIAKMSVAKRVVLALKGNKEERAILIRDGSKVISRAVLGSPKLTEAEVEAFAAQKNLSQDVLRLIAMNRKFIKDYVVLRNLAFNPRSPIDVGLSLISRLLPQDVVRLSGNRDVSDTIRKMAIKLSKTRKG